MDDSRRIETLFEEYRRQRTGFADLQRRMEAISVTATSARREVSVTAGHGGTVSDIRFLTPAYRRMTPAELTAVIMQTVADAKEQAHSAAADIIRPLVPDGIDPKDLMRGKVSAEKLLPAQPRLAAAVREQLELNAVPE